MNYSISYLKTDPSVSLASLKAGKVDYTLLNPFQYQIVKNDPRFRLEISPLNWLDDESGRL
jgi:hypothetical protein